MTYGKVYDHTNADYRAEAIERLREVFPIGSTATTIVRHVSRSGMTRTISVLTIDKRGEIRDVSMDVARVLGWSVDRDRGGVRVDGCGMDMCFHLVYSMSRALWSHREVERGGLDPIAYAHVWSHINQDELAADLASLEIESGRAGYAVSNRTV